MGESDGDAPSSTPGSTRHCLHCNKVFTVVHKSHRCGFSVCTKARQALSKPSAAMTRKDSDPSARNKRKKDEQYHNRSDLNGQKKVRNGTVSVFLSGLDLASINALGNEKLISRLCKAISLLEDQSDRMSELESMVSRLEDSLDDQAKQVARLGNEATQMKISFADTVLNLQRPPANPSSGPPGTSYASVVRGTVSSSVSVATSVDGVSSESLDLLAVEKLLDTPNSGLIPLHVRYKNNKVYVTLDNDVAVAKAADILNNKPDFQSRFNSASKLNVLFPVVALFVNISDIEALKKGIRTP